MKTIIKKSFKILGYNLQRIDKRKELLINFEYENILSKIENTTGFLELIDRYKNNKKELGESYKYLDYKRWIKINLERAFNLGIPYSKNLNILDIGSGTGYFAYICKHYGHNVRVLDVETYGLYNEFIAFFNIKKTTHKIIAYQKLPELDIKFDLITGFLVCFNMHNTSDLWGIYEWDYLLKDLRKNQLKQCGKIYFELNKEDKFNDYYTDKFYNYFLRKNALINRDKIMFY
jgi:SAM-dependent methyltransferase